MDEAVIKYYRRLLKDDFPNAGELAQPSVFIEAVGEKLINCGNTGNYMQLYLQVADNKIAAIKYLCACEPVANVAVEVLCALVQGKTLDEAAGLTEEPFFQFLGSRDEKLRGKILGLLELLKEGFAGYYAQTGAKAPVVKNSQAANDKISWDGALSS
jgi:NifU-like protein involved in Fe-S cluster formation